MKSFGWISCKFQIFNLKQGKHWFNQASLSERTDRSNSRSRLFSASISQGALSMMNSGLLLTELLALLWRTLKQDNSCLYKLSSGLTRSFPHPQQNKHSTYFYLALTTLSSNAIRYLLFFSRCKQAISLQTFPLSKERSMETGWSSEREFWQSSPREDVWIQVAILKRHLTPLKHPSTLRQFPLPSA